MVILSVLAAEQGEITAQNDMRSEPGYCFWHDAIDKVAHQKIERCFALCKGPLIERGQNLPGLYVRNQLSKQISGNDQNFTEELSLLKRTKHWKAVGRADVNP
jgi:hypothetical protein